MTNKKFGVGRSIKVETKDLIKELRILEKGWMYDHFFGEAEDQEDCIVVGNIFDNPQLKKKYGKDWEEEHK